MPRTGFLLTYLLHTTHAAKNGSRAGLGITLIQWAFYMRARAAQLQQDLANGELPSGLLGGQVDDGSVNVASDGWTLWGEDSSGITAAAADALANATATANMAQPSVTSGSGLTLSGVSLQEAMRMSSIANDWLSYALMILGWALVLGSVINFLRAVRWARAIRASNDASSAMAGVPVEAGLANDQHIILFA